MEDAAQEDLQMKRRMLELMREDQRLYTENMQMVNNNITAITNTIKDGFDLLRTVIQQQTFHLESSHYFTLKRIEELLKHL